MSTSPYNEAGKLLFQILTEHKSLRTIAFRKKKNRNNNNNNCNNRDGDNQNTQNSSFELTCSKSSYAMVCHTLQHKNAIDEILNKNDGILRKKIQMDAARNKGLLYILLNELLFGKYKKIRGGGKLKRNIVKYEKELRDAADTILLARAGEAGTSRSLFRKQIIFPRYVRVNTLKANTEDVVHSLRKTLQSYSSQHTQKEPHHMTREKIYADPHVPDLLVLSPKTGIPWHEHELIRSGKIMLQDKSSCLSALAFDMYFNDNHKVGSSSGNKEEKEEEESMGDFIDACAAPGNKTLHLAALISKRYQQQQLDDHRHILDETKKKQKTTKTLKSSKKLKVDEGAIIPEVPTIFAFDRSSSRILTLRDRIASLTPTAKESADTMMTVDVKPIHEDFLKVNPNDEKYLNVKNILLDPSCSGSGIINTPDRLLDDLHEADDAIDTKSNHNHSKNNHISKRISTLSNFQLVALKHAMSFPQVLRIVYSTCSIHEQENEHVVSSALLESNKEIADEMNQWEIISPPSLRNWKRRGHNVCGLSSDQAESLIRVDGTKGDDTNGFFVCYFQRKGVSEKSPNNDNGKYEIELPPFVDGFYNGQFHHYNEEIVTSMEPMEEESAKLDANHINNQKERLEDHSELSTKKVKDLSAKKKAKKLAWKRRQKESKFSRIKAKEEKEGPKDS